MARVEKTTAVSHVAAAVSGLLVVCLAGYLAYDAWGPMSLPTITAAVDVAETRRIEGVSYVPVEVTNSGETSATQVVVELTGEGLDVGLETVVDYLAGGESHRVVVLVTNGTTSSFHARVVSYQEP